MATTKTREILEQRVESIIQASITGHSNRDYAISLSAVQQVMMEEIRQELEPYTPLVSSHVQFKNQGKTRIMYVDVTLLMPPD